MAVRLVLTIAFTIALAECQLRGQVQRWLARSFAVAGVVAVVAAMAVFLVAPPIDGRLSGLGQLDNPVTASLVWAVLLVFSLRLCFNDRQVWWRLFGVSSAILYCIAIAMSGSRTGWVAGLLGVLVLLACTFWDRRNAVRMLSALVFLAVIGAGLVLGSGSSQTVIEYLLPRGTSFRPEIWASALDVVFPENALFGVGILTSDDFLLNGRVFQHPHSMYISMLFQGGLIALFLFLALLTWTLGVFLRFYDEVDAKLGLAILAITLSAYVLDGHELLDKVGDTWLLVWLPVGLAVGLKWSKTVSYRVT